VDLALEQPSSAVHEHCRQPQEIPWQRKHSRPEALWSKPQDGDEKGTVAESENEGEENQPMSEEAFQDHYPDDVSHCYGCGRLNEHGLQIKSHWDGNETVCTFWPRPYHTALPGYVYGGLIASLIDCHSTGTAAAAAARAVGRPMDSDPLPRFVTASLHVDYLRPTPIEGPLELRSQVKQIKGRKVVVSTTLMAHGEVCARGEVVAVEMPEHLAILSAPP
jgi:acyl-coenzyme A thioesterase PaaI-like protein